VVDEDRMKKVQLLNLQPELFTTDLETPNAIIHVKHIRELKNYE
jgi:hypothetical protein